MWSVRGQNVRAGGTGRRTMAFMGYLLGSGSLAILQRTESRVVSRCVCGAVQYSPPSCASICPSPPPSRVRCPPTAWTIGATAQHTTSLSMHGHPVQGTAFSSRLRARGRSTLRRRLGRMARTVSPSAQRPSSRRTPPTTSLHGVAVETDAVCCAVVPLVHTVGRPVTQVAGAGGDLGDGQAPCSPVAGHCRRMHGPAIT